MTLDTTVLDRLIAGSDAQLDTWLRSVAQRMVTDVKLGIQAQSPGETVTRYNPRRSHITSKPGDPPNIDTGTLINSIEWARVGRLEYWVHDGVLYGLHLEDVHNRPFMAPVFADWGAKIKRVARDEGMIRP